jgi:hypothetical protein
MVPAKHLRSFKASLDQPLTGLATVSRLVFSSVCSHDDDHIGPHGDKLVNEGRNAFYPPVRLPPVEDKIFAFDVASAPERAEKASQTGRSASPIVPG